MAATGEDAVAADISEHGRIPSEITEAYHKAH
jgi:hypothetical protein